MGNKGPFPQTSLSKGVGFFATKGARGAAGWGRGLTSRAGAGLRVHAGEERPPKEANRLLGQLDALAAAGGETFIAPGGGALAQPSRRARLLSPSGSTSRRGGAHCGSAPRTPVVCPAPCARPGSSPDPTPLQCAQPGARAVSYFLPCARGTLPARLSALVHRCSRHLAESAHFPPLEAEGEQKAFLFPSPFLLLILSTAVIPYSGIPRVRRVIPLLQDSLFDGERTHSAPTQGPSQTVLGRTCSGSPAAQDWGDQREFWGEGW